MRRHPLIWFFILAFAITWGLAGVYFLFPAFITDLLGPISISNPLFILGSWGPSLSGFLLAAVTGGRRGLVELLKRILPGRARPRWYVLSLGAVPAGMALPALAGGEPIPLSSMPAAALLSFLLINLVTGPLGEEFGWRGFALPRLLTRFRPLAAALILGAVWGAWHLPAFLMAGTPQQVAGLPYFMLTALCLSVLITWMFLRVRPSIFFSFLFHYAVNFSLNLVSGSIARLSLILTVMAALAAILSGPDLGKSGGRNRG